MGRVALLACALLAQLVVLATDEPDRPRTRRLARPEPHANPDRGIERIAVGMYVDGQTAWALEPRIERRDDGWLLRDHLGVEQVELDLDDPDVLAAEVRAWARRICWDVPRPLYLIGFEGSGPLDELAVTVHAGCTNLEVFAVEFHELIYCGTAESDS